MVMVCCLVGVVAWIAWIGYVWHGHQTGGVSSQGLDGRLAAEAMHSEGVSTPNQLPSVQQCRPSLDSSPEALVTVQSLLAAVPHGLTRQSLYARPDLIFDPPRARQEADRIDCIDEVEEDAWEAEVTEAFAEPFTLRGSIPNWKVFSGVNPATGLPLLDDSMVDVAGNPYGMDLHHDRWPDHSCGDQWSATNGIHLFEEGIAHLDAVHSHDFGGGSGWSDPF